MTLPPALDVACGSRSFYFDKQDERVFKCDAHPRHLTLCDGRTLDVSPDMVADFRELPFPDKSFNLVIFDPPHLDVGAGWQVDKYGKLDSDSWHEDLAKGFSECLRVLKPHGVLVFKWYEHHIPLKDVLKLCPAGMSLVEQDLRVMLHLPVEYMLLISVKTRLLMAFITRLKRPLKNSYKQPYK